jgi:hypothetical protein
MQSTTGLGGGSRARVIYHTPGKSFAWLHKGLRSTTVSQKHARRLTFHNADGSLADFQKALRARLNISKNEPLAVKQLDGDYTLDIETGPCPAGPYFAVFYLLVHTVRGGV